MILIIDNYDSFTYNLYQYLGELGWEPVVYRNDGITLEEIERLAPSHLIISPGPCTPLEAGISNDVIRHFAGKIPVLGVCLGHQCIGHVFGAKVGHAAVPTHGKSSPVHHDGRTIFKNLPNPFDGGRYHSLIVEMTDEAKDLEETARTEDGANMGIRHRQYTIEGIQFHPESIMTGVGRDLLTNFLSVTEPVRPEEY